MSANTPYWDKPENSGRQKAAQDYELKQKNRRGIPIGRAQSREAARRLKRLQKKGSK